MGQSHAVQFRGVSETLLPVTTTNDDPKAEAEVRPGVMLVVLPHTVPLALPVVAVVPCMVPLPLPMMAVRPYLVLGTRVVGSYLVSEWAFVSIALRYSVSVAILGTRHGGQG